MDTTAERYGLTEYALAKLRRAETFGNDRESLAAYAADTMESAYREVIERDGSIGAERLA